MSEQSKKLFESNLRQFLRKYTRVREETVQKHIVEIGTLQLRGLNEYQQINGPFQQRMMDLGLRIEDSLLLSRLWEYQFRHLHWLIFSIISGMYKESIMEMRFVLESWVQAYYIDLNYRSYSLSEKIQLLKEKEIIDSPGKKPKKQNWYGYQLFTHAFGSHTFRERIYALYDKLCDFSHSSYIELVKYQEI